MRNHIYFSVVTATILAILSILLETGSFAGVRAESYTLANHHIREESRHGYHGYKEND